MDIIKSGALRLAFQLSCARGIEGEKAQTKLSLSLSLLLSISPEPATRTKCLWVREGEGGGREDVSSSSSSPVFLFFWSLAGTVSDPICFQLPVEDDVSLLPVRYVLHMQTPKHPGVSPLSSHPFPCLSLPLSLLLLTRPVGFCLR